MTEDDTKTDPETKTDPAAPAAEQKPVDSGEAMRSMQAENEAQSSPGPSEGDRQKIRQWERLRGLFAMAGDLEELGEDMAEVAMEAELTCQPCEAVQRGIRLMVEAKNAFVAAGVRTKDDVQDAVSS